MANIHLSLYSLSCLTLPTCVECSVVGSGVVMTACEVEETSLQASMPYTPYREKYREY